MAHIPPPPPPHKQDQRITKLEAIAQKHQQAIIVLRKHAIETEQFKKAQQARDGEQEHKINAIAARKIEQKAKAASGRYFMLFLVWLCFGLYALLSSPDGLEFNDQGRLIKYRPEAHPFSFGILLGTSWVLVFQKTDWLERVLGGAIENKLKGS